MLGLALAAPLRAGWALKASSTTHFGFCASAPYMFAWAAAICILQLGPYAGLVCLEDQEDTYSHYIYTLPPEGKGPLLQIDAAVHGNEYKFINDPRSIPGATANCEFLQRRKYDKCGLPYAAIRTTARVPPHTELLVHYGDAYWDVMERRARLPTVPGSAPAQPEGPNEAVGADWLPAGHEYTSVTLWDNVPPKVLREVAQPKGMRKVRLRREAGRLVACARMTCSRGEEVGVLGGRVLLRTEVPDPGAVVYRVPGTKLRVRAENEARHFSDSADPNCELRMAWTRHGGAYVEIVAVRDIARADDMTLCRWRSGP